MSLVACAASPVQEARPPHADNSLSIGHTPLVRLNRLAGLERRKLLTAYGARLVLTEGLKGMPGAIARAQQIAIPANLQLDLVDRVEQVSSAEANHVARRLALEEGILAGIFSGAAVAAAVQLAREEERTGRTIVVVLPDSGGRYLSSVLFEGLFDDQGLAVPRSQP